MTGTIARSALDVVVICFPQKIVAATDEVLGAQVWWVGAGPSSAGWRWRADRARCASLGGHRNAMLVACSEVGDGGGEVVDGERAEVDLGDRIYGVSYANQARYLTQSYAIVKKNPRIDMFLWFLLRDERRLVDGWQSGLLTTGGVRKPAFAAFQKLRG